MIKCSIHTMELHAKVNWKTFQQLYHNLKKRKDLRIFKSDSCYRFYLGANGIMRIEAHVVKDYLGETCMCVHINIVVNPYRALGSTGMNNACLMYLSDMEYAFERIFCALYRILPQEAFDVLNISRMDFTMDMQFSNQELADLYIKLIKKGKTVRRLREKMVYDKRVGALTSYDESLLTGCCSYDFQIYSKYQQMLNRNLPGAEYAYGVVRLELRARRSKFLAIMRKHGEYTSENWISAVLSLTEEDIEQVVLEMVATSVGTGEFYPRSTLVHMIEDSRNQRRIKDEMIRIVDFLCRNDSIDTLFEKKVVDRKQWPRILKRFNQLGCSPIPIPVKSCGAVLDAEEEWQRRLMEEIDQSSLAPHSLSYQ